MKEENKKYMSGPDSQGVRYFDMTLQEDERSGNPYQSGNWGRGRRRNFWRNISIILIVILLAIIISGGIKGWMNGAGLSANIPLSSPYIATIYVEGAIQAGNTDYFGRAAGYQHEWTLDMIEQLIGDSNNYGLIIFIDSPGGTVYESDELYLKIREYQEITENPVYAVMGSTAASGGYYISAPCDKIYANRNTWTGSIGVTIGTIVDVSEFLENYGIKTKTITSGEHKAMGSSYQEMTEEEQAIWQGLVDEAYLQFADIVAEGRNLPIEYVYEIADGRILSAKQAIEAGLVDEIGGIEDAYAAMYKEIALKEDGVQSMQNVELVYENSASGLSWLFGKQQANAGR